MKPRLVILCVLFGGVAVYWATRASAPPRPEANSIGNGTAEPGAIDGDELPPLSLRSLPGDEPSVDPEFDISVEVDPTSDKHRLYFFVREAHGYYVETLDIDFYYRPTPATTQEDSPLVVPVHLDDYIKAMETYRGCADITSHELHRVGGKLGTTENWAAVVVGWHRARAENPEPLPEVSPVGKCRAVNP